MGCLKCGRDTEEGQVFCQACLTEMEDYPVRPGTAVVLPKRRESLPPRKTAKRRGPSPEEQIKMLKKEVRMLSILLAAAVLALVLAAIPAAEHLFGEHQRHGQNYTAVTSTATATAPSAP